MSKKNKNNFIEESDGEEFDQEDEQIDRIDTENPGLQEEEQVVDDDEIEEDADEEAMEGEEGIIDEEGEEEQEQIIEDEEEEDEEGEGKGKKKKTAKEEDDGDEDCLYDQKDEDTEIKKNKNKGLEEDEEDELEDEIFEEETPKQKSVIISDPKERITKPFLTKYEKVRIIGDRTQQLTLGAKPMIKNYENMTAHEIALLELEKNVIPLIIERPLPNGNRERWRISELKH